MASASGLARGMRRLVYRTERLASGYSPRAEDNQAVLKCVASVVGLRPAVELTKLDVDCEYSKSRVCIAWLLC